MFLDHALAHGFSLPRPARKREEVDPDREDVDAARAGSRDAFDRLVRRHERRVVDAARAIVRNEDDALDVSQETFLRAFRAVERFRADASFATWIVGIARNTARSLLAHRTTKKRGSGATLQGLPLAASDSGALASPTPDPHDILERREFLEAFGLAIQELGPNEYELVWRRDVTGEAYASLSRSLDLPSGTLKSRLHRARARLRRDLAAWV